MREADSTEPGSNLEECFDLPTSTNTSEKPLKAGSLICFDLRFPEAALALRRKGANVLLYPSAFTVPTGKVHWEILLRARAIENQCWVIASAQCGRHNDKRVSYGDAMIVDPNGEVKGRLEKVVDEQGEKEGMREPSLLLVDLDVGVVEKVRGNIPLHRRTDVYSEV